MAKHHPEFKSAAEMRSSLVASTAMARVKDLDEQLEDAVMQARRAGYISKIGSEKQLACARGGVGCGLVRVEHVACDLSPMLAPQAVTSAVSVSALPEALVEELGVRQFNAALMKMIQDVSIVLLLLAFPSPCSPGVLLAPPYLRAEECLALVRGLHPLVIRPCSLLPRSERPSLKTLRGCTRTPW